MFEISLRRLEVTGLEKSRPLSSATNGARGRTCSDDPDSVVENVGDEVGVSVMVAMVPSMSVSFI